MQDSLPPNQSRCFREARSGSYRGVSSSSPVISRALSAAKESCTRRAFGMLPNGCWLLEPISSPAAVSLRVVKNDISCYIATCEHTSTMCMLFTAFTHCSVVSPKTSEQNAALTSLPRL